MHSLKTDTKVEDERALCFGSRTSRFYGIKKPQSSPGPFEYTIESGFLKKLPNKVGYTLLASSNPRYKNRDPGVPPVGTYNIDSLRSPKQSAKPFGMGAKLNYGKKWVTPSPGAHSFFKRKIKVCEAFGTGPRIIVPLVVIKCGQFNMSTCFKCEEQPVGDYWHKDSTNQDMCRPCMESEWKEVNKSKRILVRYRMRKKLQMFHLMRYCGFYHDHNCTTAAVQFMPHRDLIHKLRKENYLASYGF